MFRAIILRPLAFLKWLATPEQLPSLAPDFKPGGDTGNSAFLKMLLRCESLPELSAPAETAPFRPSFLRYIFSRESLPNLSKMEPGATEDRQSQSHTQKESH